MYYFSYLLFVIAMFTYDYFQYDLTVFVRSTNETAAIERVLKQIPTCSIDDHSRQRALLYTLQQWTRLAHSHHIRYWISHESLLGYVQYHRILPHVRTIDISILADDTPELIRLTKQNFPSIYQLKIHPQWSIRKSSNRSLFLSDEIDFHRYNGQFINRQSNVSINIWPIYDQDSTLIQYDSKDQQRIIDENWIFPLHPCLFNGIKVWCPAQSMNLVLAHYGSIWTRQICRHRIWSSLSSK